MRCGIDEKNPGNISLRDEKEAQTGFEPVNQGVADPCLTTWLLRHISSEINYSKNLEDSQ